jgi:hypothetical protein
LIEGRDCHDLRTDFAQAFSRRLLGELDHESPHAPASKGNAHH